MSKPKTLIQNGIIDKNNSSSHVRFRDGEDLVEFEGSPSKSPEKSKEKFKSKPKISRAASVSGAIASSPTDKKSLSKILPQENENSNDKEAVTRKTKKKKDPSGSGSGSAEADKEKSSPSQEVPLATLQSSPSDEEDEQKLRYFSIFQTINRVHGGAIMKIKVGVAGVTPDKDSFPLFGGSKRWACLHWDAEQPPSSWAIAWYSTTPSWFDSSMKEISSSNNRNTSVSTPAEEGSWSAAAGVGVSGSAASGPSLVQSSLFTLPDIHTAVKVIRVSEISDIYLEASPSTAFRVYGGKEVVSFNPVASYNLLSRRSACWADSLYSMLALQNEPDAELVQLYKQEFVQLLEQSENERVKPQDASDGSDTAHIAGTSKRPFLRRRSTLSSLLGIAPSKPVNSDFDSETAAGAEVHETGGGKSPFKRAVSMFKRQMSSTFISTENSNKTTVNSNNNNSEFTRDNINIHAEEQDNEDNRQIPHNTHENSHNKDQSGSEAAAKRTFPLQKSKSADVASINYLSQSLMNLGFRSAPNSHSNGHSESPVRGAIGGDKGGAMPRDANIVHNLQAQIDALLQHNRLLKQQLYGDSDAEVDETVNHRAHTSTTTSPTAADASLQQREQQHQHPIPERKIYTAEELATLRSFTAQSNFHLNQHTLTNSKRAFSKPGLGDTGVTAVHDREAWLAKHKIMNKNKNNRTEVRHVLGKQTVLDAILAQTHAMPLCAQNGDDYYNDTIELDPLQLEQLIELHKLQILHSHAHDAIDQSGKKSEDVVDLQELPTFAPSPVNERRRRDSTTSAPSRSSSINASHSPLFSSSFPPSPSTRNIVTSTASAAKGAQASVQRGDERMIAGEDDGDDGGGTGEINNNISNSVMIQQHHESSGSPYSESFKDSAAYNAYAKSAHSPAHVVSEHNTFQPTTHSFFTLPHNRSHSVSFDNKSVTDPLDGRSMEEEKEEEEECEKVNKSNGSERLRKELFLAGAGVAKSSPNTHTLTKTMGPRAQSSAATPVMPVKQVKQTDSVPATAGKKHNTFSSKLKKVNINEQQQLLAAERNVKLLGMLSGTNQPLPSHSPTKNVGNNNMNHSKNIKNIRNDDYNTTNNNPTVGRRTEKVSKVGVSLLAVATAAAASAGVAAGGTSASELSNSPGGIMGINKLSRNFSQNETVGLSKPTRAQISQPHTNEEEEALDDPFVHLSAPKWNNRYDRCHDDDDATDGEGYRSNTNHLKIKSKIPSERREMRRTKKALLTKNFASATPINNESEQHVLNNQKNNFIIDLDAIVLDTRTHKSLHRVNMVLTSSLLSCENNLRETHNIYTISNSRFDVITVEQAAKLPGTYLCICSEKEDAVLIPLSGLWSADLDVNNTGLFKISLDTCDLSQFELPPTSGLLPLFDRSDSDSRSKNGLLTPDTITDATVLVCKAQNNIQLADWMGALIQAKSS